MSHTEKVQELFEALKRYDQEPEVVEYNLLEKQDMLLDYSRHSPQLQEQIDNIIELCDEVLVRDCGRPNYLAQLDLIKRARAEGYDISIAAGDDDCNIITTPVTLFIYDVQIS